MSQVSEVKCPVCGKWSSWTDKVGENCPHCNARFNPGRLQYETEKSINTEHVKLNSYLIIKDTDDTIVQMSKQFINWLRWATFYGISMIYFAVAIMLVLFGLVML